MSSMPDIDSAPRQPSAVDEDVSTEPKLQVTDSQPGALRGAITLTLETGQALRLVKGRAGASDKVGIIGLIGFAGLLRPIWHGARSDDPYADWWLIKVHEALEKAEAALSAALAEASAPLGRSEAITATPAASTRPVRVPLRFSNPYAYRGAHLVADYDRLVRAVLTAQHIGAMTRQDGERAVQLGGRPLRRAFLSPLGYRLTGTTRRDLIEDTALSVEARERMGDVPPDILGGERRAPYAPLRSAPVSSATGHIALRPLAAGG